MDDTHFGPPLAPTPMQDGEHRSVQGRLSRRIREPANYRDNFSVEADASGQRSRLIAPLRLPKTVAATTAALGDIDLEPNHGESDGARWFMTDQDSIPYSADADARIPLGTVIPGRHREGRVLGRPRRRAMRRPLGVGPLGARGQAAARHQERVRRTDPKRRLHARRSFRSQPDQTHTTRSTHSY
jgi:hypothetical protein